MIVDLQLRWKEMHKRFFDGLINQVHCQIDERMFSRDVQEYMDMRRGTIGAYPAIALTEYDAMFSFSPNPSSSRPMETSTILTH